MAHTDTSTHTHTHTQMDACTCTCTHARTHTHTSYTLVPCVCNCVYFLFILPDSIPTGCCLACKYIISVCLFMCVCKYVHVWISTAHEKVRKRNLFVLCCSVKGGSHAKHRQGALSHSLARTHTHTHTHTTPKSLPVLLLPSLLKGHD